MTYSFNSFYNEAKAIAEKADIKDFKVEVSRHPSRGWEFLVYMGVHGCFVEATPQECLSRCSMRVLNKVPVCDLTIDLPQSA